MTDPRSSQKVNSFRFRRNWVKWWLTPLAKDRDSAFRERVTRSTLLIVVSFGLISFVLGELIFRSEWTLFSYPTLHLATLSLCFISGYMVINRRLQAAGWFLVLTVLLAIIGILLLAHQDQSLSGVISGFAAIMLVPIMVALLLPRAMILPMSLVCIFAYIMIQMVAHKDFQIDGFSTAEQLSTLFILLFTEGALLRQLRWEFDARFDSMQHSLQEVEKARSEAEQDRKRAEEADRAKSQFLANMSHELRTPLNAIIGYDSAMLGGMVGEFTSQQEQLLGHIHHNSRRLLSLINDILDLSKIESGSLQMNFTPVSPFQALTRAAHSLRSLALEKQIDLKVALDTSAPEVVLCDSNKLEQIIINLIGNAIKFTSEGGVTLSAGSENQNDWYFSVQDTGIGIAQDQQNLIFSPFYEVDNDLTRKYKGTGLGLAITKRLVEELGGTIQVKSELGNGSTFTVFLPKAAVAEKLEVIGAKG